LAEGEVGFKSGMGDPDMIVVVTKTILRMTDINVDKMKVIGVNMTDVILERLGGIKFGRTDISVRMAEIKVDVTEIFVRMAFITVDMTEIFFRTTFMTVVLSRTVVTVNVTKIVVRLRTDETKLVARSTLRTGKQIFMTSPPEICQVVAKDLPVVKKSL